MLLELSGKGSPEEIMSRARIARKYLNDLCREVENEDGRWFPV